MAIVSLLKCEKYELLSLKNVINNSFSNLGGIEKFINKGETVFLKINLVMKKRPEEAATTNPLFVRALCEVLLEYGARVIVGDSPGGPFNEKALKNIYDYCGISEIAENFSVILNMNTKSKVVSNPTGLIMKKLIIAEMLEKADKVISVGKLKTHGMMKMTGAVKNMFGVIPGAVKAEYHLNLSDLDNFANALIDICCYVNPVLSFIDAIVGMEGNGPTAGTPRKVGAVISSENPFFADLAASKIITKNPLLIPTIKQSIERGLCSEADLKIIGDNPEKFYIKDFKLPKVKNINPIKDKLPSFANKLISSSLQQRPDINIKDCISCGDCFKNCPPKAIEFKNNFPKIDLDKCIRCFCCQELCPKKAIDIYNPVLFRLLSAI